MLGDKIKELRKALGLSQTALADKVGVSKQTLYKYENNIITNVPSDKLEAIAKELSTTPAYLMGWEEPKDETYYTDPETNAMAQSLFENSDMRVLFDAAKDATPEQLKMAADMLKMFKETNKE